MSNKKVILFSVIPSMAIGFFVGRFFYHMTPDLKSDQQRASYALGQQIGKNFRNQNIEIEPRAFSLSIEESLRQKPSRLSESELSQALSYLHQQVAKKQPIQAAPAAPELDVESRKLKEAFAQQPGIQQTRSGVPFLILKQGKISSGPDKTLKFHMKVTSLTGEVYEDTEAKKNFLRLPLQALPEGMQEIIETIKAGGRAKALFSAEELSRNSPFRFPSAPGQPLVIELQILEK